MSTQNYIVFDLEWNQPPSKQSRVYKRVGERLRSEIIQIGAVKLNVPDLAPVDTFSTIVRPRYYTHLADRIRKITNITSEDLRTGELFPVAITDFAEWCGKDSVFLTWGPDDVSVLRQNLEFYGMSDAFISDWYDLQLIFNEQTGASGQKSLTFAAEHFCIEQALPMHNALNDAFYTALVCEELDLQKGIVHYPNLAEHRFSNNAQTISKTIVEDVTSKRDALHDQRISKTECPDCGRRLMSKSFVHQSGNRYITLAECPEHGRFLIQVRFQRGETLKAHKLLFAADADAERMYTERIRKSTRHGDTSPR